MTMLLSQDNPTMTLILLAPAAILAGHHRRLVLVLFLAFFLDRLSSFTPLTVVSVRQHREQQEHHSPPTGITMAGIRFVHSLGFYVRDSSARLLLYRLKPQRRCSHVVFSTLPPNDNANKNDKDDPGDERRMPHQNAINGGANTVHVDGEKIPKTIVTPTLPQSRLTSLPDKGDLYPVDELEKILNLHQTLADNNAFDDDNNNSAGINESTWSPLTSHGSPISFHELVLQAVKEADQNPLKGTNRSSRSSSDSAVPAPAIVQKYAQLIQNNDNNNSTNNLRQRLSKIRAIASDVDGTLLNHNLTLHPMTRQAIQDAVAAMPQNKDDAFQNHGNNGNPKKNNNNNNNNDHGNDEPRPPFVAFFPATGKTRAGALHSLGPDVARWLSKLPGVFGQGLQCVNATGHVVFEQKLDPTNANNNDAMMMGDVMDATEAMVHQDGLTMVGVNGDVLYTTATSAETNPHHLDLISSLWGEPRPLILPNTLSSIRNYKPGFHKLIVMADTVEEIQAFRPKWEALAKPVNATILCSVPTLLELLPPGCGKEVGVRYLCESLGIDMGTELLAIGDGENDLKMLQQAAVGVAMGNAVDLVKQAHGVDIVLDETNEEGGAGLAISLFGLGKVLEQQHECDG